jgi:hypothetical protein
VLENPQVKILGGSICCFDEDGGKTLKRHVAVFTFNITTCILILLAIHFGSTQSEKFQSELICIGLSLIQLTMLGG